MSSQAERLADRLSPSAIDALLSAKPNGLVWEIRGGDPALIEELAAEHHVFERPEQWILSRSGLQVLEVLQTRPARARRRLHG